MSTARRVCVVGGSGFIGQHIVQTLIEAAWSPIVVGKARPPANPLVEFMALDLRDQGSTHAFFTRHCFDAVVNCSGVIDQSAELGMLPKLTASLLLPALNLIETIAVTQDDCIFLQVGSNAEYGDAECPHSPLTAPQPNSAYGALKLASSAAVLSYRHHKHIRVCVLRPFLVFGPGAPANNFIELLTGSAHQAKPLRMTLGTQTRDFIHVNRVACDVVKLLETDFGSGSIFNSCSGIERSLRSVVEIARSYCPALQAEMGALPFRAGEMMRSVGIPLTAYSHQQHDDDLHEYLRTSLHRRQTNV